MHKRQINQLNNMRLQGYKPTYIAKTLGISVNTVKSHIRRHPKIPNTHNCENCGKPVLQNEGRKLKRFCSDKCRSSYWNNQRKKGVIANDAKVA